MELDCRDDRKTSFHNGAYDQPAFERISRKVVRIRGINLARQVLRSAGFRQAGFMAELASRFTRSSGAPVLFQEGEAHRKQRSATAPFFAPKMVATRYRQLIAEKSARLMNDLRSPGHADLDTMGMELSVAVTAEIVGPTDSSQSGLSNRLNSFLADKDRESVGTLANSVRMALAFYRMLRFFFCDVMPAIRSRRALGRDDIISHLIDQGYSTREILTECITYGGAGVATTRELIVVAAWHLFDSPDLRKRFLDSDETGRIVVLEEVLRLEPVVGALYRRAEQDMVLNDSGRTEGVTAGTLLAIDIRAVNADPAAAGVCPHRLDPDRQIQDHRLPRSLMSFGDGPHRCPGAAVALQESVIFLEQLFRIPGIRLARTPTIASNLVVESYELRGAIVTCI
ncbi:cytochrome P450 [Bradyrhizobium sp. Ash2021]|uniref:cytochrome P450 n=1 Tax=Bradyrhizobium sp. Ash2021 TaxID=2954771 RepID=UPI00281622CE|nr:cytochrome P450 [Bradyrhizobium sp. Ash2021]WMT73897.1 cytochrome P450 [Bradyrhizobium sp. Ash2021]